MPPENHFFNTLLKAQQFAKQAVRACLAILRAPKKEAREFALPSLLLFVPLS